MLNPDDFIITRKRKKYKFANFSNFSNCYELEEVNIENALDNKNITLELGAGNGIFSLGWAKAHPETFVIALDLKADRLYTGAKQALEEKIDNIIFVRSRADLFLDLLKPHSIDTIWLTFSDPYPKKRQAKHRLTHPDFLGKYRKVLKESGVLLQKTDNDSLFEWGKEQLIDSDWRIVEESRDLHAMEGCDDIKIKTGYEKRYLKESKNINYLKAKPI